MESAQREELKQIISALIAELQESLSQKTTEEFHLNKAEERVQELKRSMNRLNDEEFGLCVRCHDEIPFDRLKIFPETKVCMNCLQSE